jgi:hypothetical protein
MHSHLAHLPAPSKQHATCAWCDDHFDTIVELLDHVEITHLSQRTTDACHAA